MDKGEANVSFVDRDGQCSVTVSEIPRNFLPKLAGGDGMFGRHTEEATHKACVH